MMGVDTRSGRKNNLEPPMNADKLKEIDLGSGQSLKFYRRSLALIGGCLSVLYF